MKKKCFWIDTEPTTRMLKTAYVRDNYEILATDLKFWWPILRIPEVTNMLVLSPTSLDCQQQKWTYNVYTNITVHYITEVFEFQQCSQLSFKINRKNSRLYRWRAALKPAHFTSSTYNIRKPIINKWNFIFLISSSEFVEIWKVFLSNHRIYSLVPR